MNSDDNKTTNNRSSTNLHIDTLNMHDLRVKTSLEKLDDMYSVLNQLKPLCQIVIKHAVEVNKKELSAADIEFIDSMYPWYFPVQGSFEIQLKIKDLKFQQCKILNCTTSRTSDDVKQLRVILNQLDLYEKLVSQLAKTNGVIAC